jgi:hypothetical protein
MIRYLHRRQIDDERWNRVVSSSPFETIYAYTWYLDACADYWAALVMDDYTCIMPVAFRKKIGLKYTYQPVFCQQLGVFSALPVDPEIVRMFLHALSRRFNMGEYACNEGNVVGEEPGLEVTDNTNYLLPLKAPYEEVWRNYSENCRRNVKKAAVNDLRFTEAVSIDEVIALKKNSSASIRSQQHYAYVRLLFNRLKAMDKIRICGARVGDHLVAAAIFAFSQKRVFFLMSASSERGKERRAMFLVVDTFIQRHAGKDLKLDFEGSNIASIARFFRGFGAKPQIYQRISFSNTVSKLRSVFQRG